MIHLQAAAEILELGDVRIRWEVWFGPADDRAYQLVGSEEEAIMGASVRGGTYRPRCEFTFHGDERRP